MPKQVTQTFTETVTYTEYEPGDEVRLLLDYPGLPAGVYRVARFNRPLFAGDSPIVFVEGHRHGLLTAMVEPVESRSNSLTSPRPQRVG